MARETVSFEGSEDYTVTRPSEPARWIRDSDWQNLKADVKEIGDPGQVCSAAWWGLKGLAVAFGIVAVQQLYAADYKWQSFSTLGIVCWFMAPACLVGAISFFCQFMRARTQRRQSKKRVLTEMGRIESRSTRLDPSDFSAGRALMAGASATLLAEVADSEFRGQDTEFG